MSATAASALAGGIGGSVVTVDVVANSSAADVEAGGGLAVGESKAFDPRA